LWGALRLSECWDGIPARSMALCGERSNGFGRMVMPSRNIGIVVAMRREVAPLLAGIRPAWSGEFTLYYLENAIVAVSGIGRQAAAKAAEGLLKRHNPDLLISAGIAGALTPRLKVGDVVRIREVMDGAGRIYFDPQGGTETLVTVSSVSGLAEKKALAEKTGATVVDMEASAVASVAQGYRKKFVAIKAISDELDFEMPPVGEFVSESGRFEAMRFAMFLATRPKWWAVTVRLGINSRTAAVNLSRELQHLTRYGLQRSEEKVFGA